MDLTDAFNLSGRSRFTLWPALPPELAREVPLRRLALVTDAWKPQTNGVVNTLVRLVDYLESQGTEVLVVSPDAHRTLPLPSYPEIRVACDPWRAIPRIEAFAPDAIHVATEGPLGFWAVGWLRRAGLRFTTSFHTRYAEYLSARLPVPLEWGYQLVRWFHERATHTLVSSKALLHELQDRRVGGQLVHWPRGVDATLFHPDRRRRDLYALPRPIWLYVGRVAVEKTLEDFLGLPLEGSKVVVGDGPSRADLERRFPDVVWRGYRFGEDLAAHFASADCFVFPSRTETFGNVLLEAMASGLPVASVPAPGPVDLVEEGVNGAIDDQLMRACLRGLRCSREKARASVLGRTLRAGHEVFRAHLVPMAPDGAAARFSPAQPPAVPAASAAAVL
ncbi:MAG TPA: glycosyltransferase family 1 protein [Polyangia bacterium]|jgi:glycosyltransferase involved in cell wall biosynthesis|nr:glycosyltransferase family 1 protein [Polyangia bacterium]